MTGVNASTQKRSMWSSYRSQFSTQQPNFLKMFFGTMGKKWIFRFFEIFIFDVLGPFSFFLLCLCIGHKSPHWTYKHNFWYVGSLWHSKSKKKKMFWKFSFLTIWRPFWKCKKTMLSNFSPTVHSFWHMNLMFWKYDL